MSNGKRVVGLLITVSGLALSVGCNSQSGTTPAGGGDAAKQDIGTVLAEVNGSKLGSTEFDEAFSRTMPRGPEGENQDESARKMEVLDRMVADELLYQEALRKGLDKDPKIKRMMINTLLRQDVYGQLKNNDISDEELSKYFEAHKDEFIVPEKVQVKRILVKVDADTPDGDAKTKADGLLAQVKANPESFKDVAIKDSEDSFARRGGDIGFISKEGKPGLDPKVVEEAFKLEANQLSEVFKTDEGYNIVMVVNKRERVERTFEQMKGAVLRKLKTEKSKEIQDKYIEDLKKNAKITKFEDKLKEHQPAKRAAGGMGGPEGIMPAGGELPPGMPGAPGGAPGGAPMMMGGPEGGAPMPAGAPAGAPGAPGGAPMGAPAAPEGAK